jgi:hypothetical protein
MMNTALNLPIIITTLYKVRPALDIKKLREYYFPSHDWFQREVSSETVHVWETKCCIEARGLTAPGYYGLIQTVTARSLYSRKMAVFLVVAPCSLVEVYQRFRGPCCLHLTQNTAIFVLIAVKTSNSTLYSNFLRCG